MIFFSLDQFKGAHKTGSKTWRFRCLLEKFEGTRNAFTKKLANHIDDPFAFCEELEHTTRGIVHHERKESSPELFPSPKPAPPKPQKKSASTEQGLSQQAHKSNDRSRKRKDLPSGEPGPSAEPGPSKRPKQDLQKDDIEAELQAHYIGMKIQMSLSYS